MVTWWNIYGKNLAIFILKKKIDKFVSFFPLKDSYLMLLGPKMAEICEKKTFFSFEQNMKMKIHVKA